MAAQTHPTIPANSGVISYPAGLTDVLIPTFPAQLDHRPLFMSNAVFNELYGPPHNGSPERFAWETRPAAL
jgi:hypothetical protein